MPAAGSFYNLVGVLVGKSVHYPTPSDYPASFSRSYSPRAIDWPRYSVPVAFLQEPHTVHYSPHSSLYSTQVVLCSSHQVLYTQFAYLSESCVSVPPSRVHGNVGNHEYLYLWDGDGALFVPQHLPKLTSCCHRHGSHAWISLREFRIRLPRSLDLHLRPRVRAFAACALG